VGHSGIFRERLSPFLIPGRAAKVMMLFKGSPAFDVNLAGFAPGKLLKQQPVREPRFPGDLPALFYVSLATAWSNSHGSYGFLFVILFMVHYT
jgi:hypothetical protein